MSGLAITVPGAAFSRFIDSAIPWLSLANGYYLFGTDVATSKHNYAVGASVDLTEVGAANNTYGTGYVSMAVGGYYDTGISLTNDQTILIASQMPSDTEYLCTPSAGGGLTMRGGGVTQARADASTGGTSVISHAVGVDYMLLGVSSIGTTGGTTKLYTSSGGVITETVSGGTHAANLLTATTMKLGHSANFASGIAYRMAAAMTFDTQLTLAQITDIFNYWRYALPKRGAISIA